MAERFGLDRLRGDDGMNVSGIDILRRWAGRRLGPGDLVRAATFGSYSLTSTFPVPGRTTRWPSPAPRSTLACVDYADRVEERARDVGLEFRDTTPARRIHVWWLFLRLRHGMTWTAIADRDAARPDAEPDKAQSDAAVRQAVGRLAVDVEVNI